MHRIVTTLVKLAPFGVLAAALLGCAGELYDDPAYYPSDALIATDAPVYYGGQAMYFYGGRWFYRDGGRWNYYRSEPGYLRQYRVGHPSARWGARGGGGARGRVRGGGHGGRR